MNPIGRWMLLTPIVAITWSACGPPPALRTALASPGGVAQLDLSAGFLRGAGDKQGEIRGVPPEIGTLWDLRVLQLAGNRLTALPESIGDLASLEILDLRANYLSSLPASIGRLSNLKLLYLSGNPLSEDEVRRIREALPAAMVVFVSPDLFDHGPIRPTTPEEEAEIRGSLAQCEAGEAKVCQRIYDILYDAGDAERGYLIGSIGCRMEEKAKASSVLNLCTKAGDSAMELYRVLPKERGLDQSVGIAHGLFYYRFACDQGYQPACSEIPDLEENLQWWQVNEAQRAAMQAQFEAQLAQTVMTSATTLAAGVANAQRQIDAGRAGQPLPETIVPGQQGAVANPAGALAAPGLALGGDPGAGCGRCEALCASGRAACTASGDATMCRMADACMCTCHLLSGGCGEAIDRVRLCVQDNERTISELTAEAAKAMSAKLGAKGAEELAGLLEAGLRGADAAERAQAIFNVVATRNTELAGNVLGTAFGDESSEVRRLACWALSTVGGAQELESLRRIADDDASARVREAARLAVEALEKAPARSDEPPEDE
jgi:hypothetical protein